MVAEIGQPNVWCRDADYVELLLGVLDSSINALLGLCHVLERDRNERFLTRVRDNQPDDFGGTAAEGEARVLASPPLAPGATRHGGLSGATIRPDREAGYRRRLNSAPHRAWTLAQASTLEDRTRYTTTSTFDTFPWPDPDEATTRAVATAAETMIGLRDRLCIETNLGLTDLYNMLEEGGYRELRDAQLILDRAVTSAYGWPASVVTDENEMNRRVLDRSIEIANTHAQYGGPVRSGDSGDAG